MDKCTWVLSGGDATYWDTDCGQSFCFEVDGPKENGFAYCPYCGDKIKVKKHEAKE